MAQENPIKSKKHEDNLRKIIKDYQKNESTWMINILRKAVPYVGGFNPGIDDSTLHILARGSNLWKIVSNQNPGRRINVESATLFAVIKMRNAEIANLLIDSYTEPKHIRNMVDLLVLDLPSSNEQDFLDLLDKIENEPKNESKDDEKKEQYQ
ncbi:MAG TPA: hypothetical protein VEP90_28410 [Methylomirabilota bacterium]|nr:hypothetical protein [Methylomirabilota bacterium]